MATLPEQRVLDMVRAGTITRDEGDRLIGALQPRPARWKMIYNPFDQLSTGALWASAIVVSVASFGVARLGIRFDGTLDLHPINIATPWNFALLDFTSAVVVTSLIFWLTSRIVARDGRVLDFMLSVAAARLPNVLLAGLIPYILPPSDVLQAEAEAGIVNIRVLVASLLLMMPGLIWFITWLCTAFKSSSGLKGVRLAIAFPAALITSEIVSKIFLYVVSPRI